MSEWGDLAIFVGWVLIWVVGLGWATYKGRKDAEKQWKERERLTAIATDITSNPTKKSDGKTKRKEQSK